MALTAIKAAFYLKALKPFTTQINIIKIKIKIEKESKCSADLSSKRFFFLFSSFPSHSWGLENGH